MVPGGRATLRNITSHVSFGSLSKRIDRLPSQQKKLPTNAMSALEELAKLPGYSDDGLTAVVPIRAVNFTSSRLPPGSASSSSC